MGWLGKTQVVRVRAGSNPVIIVAVRSDDKMRDTLLSLKVDNSH